MAKKTGPFDHVKQIYNGGPFLGDEGYATYIINKELSKNGELCELVNEFQQYTLPNEIHHKVMSGFFPYSQRPGFNAFPWIWKGSQKAEPEVVAVAKYYEESIDNAEVMVEILSQTKDGKKHLKYLVEIYGYKEKK